MGISVPMKPKKLSPNIRGNPTSENIRDAMQKSTRFLMATLMLFLARTKPLSKQQKSACMVLTRMAHKITQRISSMKIIEGQMHFKGAWDNRNTEGLQAWANAIACILLFKWGCDQKDRQPSRNFQV